MFVASIIINAKESNFILVYNTWITVLALVPCLEVQNIFHASIDNDYLKI